MSGIDAVTAMNEVAERYIAAWNEADADSRREAIAEQWTDDGRYTDPLADATGHDAIEAVISQARQQFPGYVFVLRGGVDSPRKKVAKRW